MFDVSEHDEYRASLVHIANGAVLPNDMADKILAAKENGENELMSLSNKRKLKIRTSFGRRSQKLTLQLLKL